MAFATFLFSDPPHLMPLGVLNVLSDDARARLPRAPRRPPGHWRMLAWSAGSLRLDLSVSVLDETVTEDSFWEAFPRSDLDAIALGMQAAASAAT